MATVGAAAAALAYRSGATFFDTRSQAQRQAAPLVGAVSVTSEALVAGELPPGIGNGPYYVVCEFGASSEIDCLYLRSSGLEAYSVLGGAAALLQALEAGET